MSTFSRFSRLLRLTQSAVHTNRPIVIRNNIRIQNNNLRGKIEVMLTMQSP